MKKKSMQQMREHALYQIVNGVNVAEVLEKSGGVLTKFLDGQGISACVGMNPITFLTSGSFGFPGVALLYGITFYQIM